MDYKIVYITSDATHHHENIMYENINCQFDRFLMNERCRIASKRTFLFKKKYISYSRKIDDRNFCFSTGI